MTSRVAFMLRAFSYPNYRLFFGGQIVSLIGSWISMTATSWLVYRLTGSAMALGVVGFAGQIPGFVMGPFAGAYLDRWDRHRVLVVTQTISMLQSFALAVLTFTGHITVPAIIALNAVQGMVNAFDMPARQAFLTTMISDREDLANAIALNSSMFNAARLVGPSDRRAHDRDSRRVVVLFRRRRQLFRRHHRARRDEGRQANRPSTKRMPASWSISSKDGGTCSGSAPSGR